MHHAQVGLEHELGTDFDEAAEVDAALSSLAARGRAYELELAGWLLRAEALPSIAGSASPRWPNTRTDA